MKDLITAVDLKDRLLKATDKKCQEHFLNTCQSQASKRNVLKVLSCAMRFWWIFMTKMSHSQLKKKKNNNKSLGKLADRTSLQLCGTSRSGWDPVWGRKHVLTLDPCKRFGEQVGTWCEPHKRASRVRFPVFLQVLFLHSCKALLLSSKS